MSYFKEPKSYPPSEFGLYTRQSEHDACGVGLVTDISGAKSHRIISQGITILINLMHRGAAGGEDNTGDGAGILTQIPDMFFRKETAKQGMVLPPAGKYGVGMVFLPKEQDYQERCRKIIEKTVLEKNCKLIGWRDVPCDDSVLGESARQSQPSIHQFFITGNDPEEKNFERTLYIIRRCAEAYVVYEKTVSDCNFYIVSLSCKTIVYKGLFLAPQLSKYYLDLENKDFSSAIALVHQRYSTNTFPTWPLAQPFRFIAHNGEINTLRGNINHLRSRESTLSSPLYGKDLSRLLPVIDEKGSDSACFDNTAEFLIHGGRSLPHVLMMMMPEAWGTKYPIGPDKKGFFEFHATHMEPWDGPAALAFSDGIIAGCCLDRNGLRPARYVRTKDGTVVLASEAGVINFAPEEIAEKGKLGAGQMILIDTGKKRFLKNTEVKSGIIRRQPYRRWAEENLIWVRGLFDTAEPAIPDAATLQTRQALFGYTREDITLIITPMASDGHEPVGSMGADAPLAVLSERPQLLFNYFKQFFAQITNPAIDPLREDLVMSLMTYIGRDNNLLEETPRHAQKVKLQHPILTNQDLETIRALHNPNFKTATISIYFPFDGNGTVLEKTLDEICGNVRREIQSGATAIILSDKNIPAGMLPIPVLLAAAAVNGFMVREGLRTLAGLILETGEPREVMHIALLLGFGATAVNPYLALETVSDLAQSGKLHTSVSPCEATINYINALKSGIYKIMSKMGISTLRSYRSAQLFEIIGIDQNVCKKYFPGAVSRIGGLDLNHLAQEVRNKTAPQEGAISGKLLPAGGFFKWNPEGESHLWSPEAIAFLRRAVRENNSEAYRSYTELINDQSKRQFTLRGLFSFKQVQSPVNISEVETADKIIKRFVTGAMSFGSISPEAHMTIAEAMNRLGAKSNSGEGGEDPERYQVRQDGKNLRSAIKQVASGRFGVTAEYLVNADEIQIKAAQGAKPGEGGQLPGHKVDAIIARVRHSTAGVTLISPPPHHDIYSIEDLAQLIYDLKCVNQKARISVKLVSENGVGTVAAGVAKAHADMVLISGFDGGTGAAPLTSIRHAGIPWELGLAETQQTLVLNNLRNRIKVQVDGQIKTGRDVVIGALLGAEEFGFATTALVTMGCVMMRKCHNNTCPVGVATQDPVLRKNFSGKPEYLINFFQMLAEEVRSIMASLGVRTFDELVGRTDILEKTAGIEMWKVKGIDFTKIFTFTPGYCSGKINPSDPKHLDYSYLSKAEDAIENGKKTLIRTEIRNINRSAGAVLAGMTAKKYGNKGLPPETLHCIYQGTAGQSFGAWCVNGMRLDLEGEANDYLGKGCSGGIICVYPPRNVSFDPSENIIAGNVLLYGATGGEIYINGIAGERFAIRNSGAKTVVEGVGDHGCEYMTGGRAVILGRTGLNFAAGMSGGIAYVLDEKQTFDQRCNLDTVDLEPLTENEDIAEVKDLIKNHAAYTGSGKAKRILDNWDMFLPMFIKVFPMEYRKVSGKMMKADAETNRAEVIHG